MNLTKEEVKQLVTKYDFNSVGKFAYCDFLQSCVLLFKQQEVSPLQRIVIQNPRVQVNIPNMKGEKLGTTGDGVWRCFPSTGSLWSSPASGYTLQPFPINNPVYHGAVHMHQGIVGGTESLSHYSAHLIISWFCFFLWGAIVFQEHNILYMAET